LFDTQHEPETSFSPPPSPRPPRSVSARGSVCGVNWSVSEADLSLYPVPRLRIRGVLPQLHHMLSWCARGQLCVMFVYWEGVKMQKPIFASYRTLVGRIEWTARLFGSPGDRVAAKICYHWILCSWVHTSWVMSIIVQRDYIQFIMFL
jgi:hypothetical protein